MTLAPGSWDWFRRLRGRAAAPGGDAGERERTRQPSVDLERCATRELLALDRFVRALYAELSEGRPHRGTTSPLIAPEARFDLGGGRWCPPDLAPRGPAAGPRRDLRLLERARTVHVVADVAVVISTCDVIDAVEAWTVVHCMQLRRSSTGWVLHELVSREGTYAVSEKVADPRPLTVRRAARR